MEKEQWKGREVCAHIDSSKEVNNGHGNIMVIVIAAWVKNRRQVLTLPLKVIPNKSAAVVGQTIKAALHEVGVTPYCFVTDEGTENKKAIREWFPKANAVFCCSHKIHNCFKKFDGRFSWKKWKISSTIEMISNFVRSHNSEIVQPHRKCPKVKEVRWLSHLHCIYWLVEYWEITLTLVKSQVKKPGEQVVATKVIQIVFVFTSKDFESNA